MRKRLIVTALTFSILFSSYASLTQSVVGICALHENLESSGSKEYRQKMAGRSVDELISETAVPFLYEDEVDPEESFYDSLSETFSQFDEVASQIIPTHPHRETLFFESYVSHFASRCYFWEEKLTTEHEVTQLCYQRVRELNQFLSLVGRFVANPLKLDHPLAPTTCSAIQSFAKTVRMKIDRAFLGQSKRFDQHFPFVRFEAHKALSDIESKALNLRNPFQDLEAALEGIDLDIRMHCRWSLAFDDVQEAFYKFIFLLIF